MMDYDRWKLSTPEEEYERFHGKPIRECEVCESGLYKGHEAIKDEDSGFIFCSSECFEEFVNERKHYITIGEED